MMGGGGGRGLYQKCVDPAKQKQSYGGCVIFKLLETIF